MREPTFLILSALVGPPLHGYAVMREAATLSAGQITLSAGTLYAALDRLAIDGMIEVDREESVDGRVRRYYRLTDRGGDALRREAALLNQRAEMAANRLASWQPQLPA